MNSNNPPTNQKSDFLSTNDSNLKILSRSQVPRKITFSKLKPGHSPLDWARLKNSGQDLRNVSDLKCYTLEELAKHNTRKDCWMCINGKIYNVTAYLPFHPGGKGELMRGAGKDGTELFGNYKPLF
ncbi:hypothetical protein BB558_005124 [Smittium angustum]|uniref:Cytochrome b5 heme-binding domain-containing protein n=1 Tax=Smittium angustum TaxID=133377 RepID=A0A2U1J1B4_SMIAN|nr:hypothetical protein BB558_005124 [Smittium angustum]